MSEHEILIKGLQINNFDFSPDSVYTCTVSAADFFLIDFLCDLHLTEQQCHQLSHKQRAGELMCDLVSVCMSAKMHTFAFICVCVHLWQGLFFRQRWAHEGGSHRGIGAGGLFQIQG